MAEITNAWVDAMTVPLTDTLQTSESSFRLWGIYVVDIQSSEVVQEKITLARTTAQDALLDNTTIGRSLIDNANDLQTNSPSVHGRKHRHHIHNPVCHINAPDSHYNMDANDAVELLLKMFKAQKPEPRTSWICQELECFTLAALKPSRSSSPSTIAFVSPAGHTKLLQRYLGQIPDDPNPLQLTPAATAAMTHEAVEYTKHLRHVIDFSSGASSHTVRLRY
jgi:hypothetical protein